MMRARLNPLLRLRQQRFRQHRLSADPDTGSECGRADTADRPECGRADTGHADAADRLECGRAGTGHPDTAAGRTDAVNARRVVVSDVVICNQCTRLQQYTQHIIRNRKTHEKR